ncbi:hypothetical protein, partial [Thermodesulfitimonas sp.]
HLRRIEEDAHPFSLSAKVSQPVGLRYLQLTAPPGTGSTKPSPKVAKLLFVPHNRYPLKTPNRLAAVNDRSPENA